MFVNHYQMLKINNRDPHEKENNDLKSLLTKIMPYEEFYQQ